MRLRIRRYAGLLDRSIEEIAALAPDGSTQLIHRRIVTVGWSDDYLVKGDARPPGIRGRKALMDRYGRRVCHVLTAPDELTVRCLASPDVAVRLYDRYFPDEYGTGFSVELEADGMRAWFGPVEVWVWDDVDLSAFVAGLAEDFRGWTGQRIWSTNHLRIDADYHSRGRVAVRWTLQPWLTRADGWSASVTTWVEAGAQMSRLADELRLFLPDVRTRQGT